MRQVAYFSLLLAAETSKKYPHSYSIKPIIISQMYFPNFGEPELFRILFSVTPLIRTENDQINLSSTRGSLINEGQSIANY